MYHFINIGPRDRVIPQWSQQQPMSVLLIQGCSKSKNSPNGTVPALDLYSGFFFKIIKKAMRDGEFDDRIDIWILSAEYGLIDEETKIQLYDKRMDAERAAELAPTVSQTLQQNGAETYDFIIVNVGSDYRDALIGLDELDKTEIYYINGEGIGVKGHKLKRIVRGELSVAQPMDEKKGTV